MNKIITNTSSTAHLDEGSHSPQLQLPPHLSYQLDSFHRHRCIEIPPEDCVGRRTCSPSSSSSPSLPSFPLLLSSLSWASEAEAQHNTPRMMNDLSNRHHNRLTSNNTYNRLLREMQNITLTVTLTPARVLL